MTQATVIRIGQERFRLVATIEEGQSSYFTAGAAIAVEKYDMRIGRSEFDFQVASRRVRGGTPESIASTQDSMDREFLENRVKSNLYGLPVSVGNLVGMARERRVQLTYGEVRPQVFRSGVETRPVAWRIWFKRTWYTGAASGRGRTPKPTDGTNARSSANGSARIGGVSRAGDPAWRAAA